MGRERQIRLERREQRAVDELERQQRRSVSIPLVLFLLFGAALAVRLYIIDADAVNPPAFKPSTAVIQTSAGDISVELDRAAAPKTVDNFVKLANENLYDGTTFHRVIADFMIQGGDPNSKDDDPSNDGLGGPGYEFADEINPRALGLSEEAIKTLESQGYQYNFDLPSQPLVPGALAMANSGPNTNGSQFFIVTTKDQPHLNGKHTVFGRVTQGMDVVLKIKQGDVIKHIDILEPGI